MRGRCRLRLALLQGRFTSGPNACLAIYVRTNLLTSLDLHSDADGSGLWTVLALDALLQAVEPLVLLALAAENGGIIGKFYAIGVGYRS